MEDTNESIHIHVNMYKHIHVCLEREHIHMPKSLAAYLLFVSLKDLLPSACSCLRSYDNKKGMDFLPPPIW